MAQMALGFLDDAMKSHQIALDIRKETQGEEHHELAWSYEGIADVLCRQGKYNEAIEYYEKAYKVRRNGLGEDHPDTARCHKKLEEAKEIKKEFKKR